MEKASSEKQPERDEHYVPRTLKAKTILTVFDTLDLEERRDLIPRLFRKAELVNGYTSSNTSPEFISWICSTHEEWKREEVEGAWEIWNLLYRRVSGGILYINEEYKLIATVWSSYYPGNVEEGCEINKFYNIIDGGDMKYELPRKDFFYIVLDECNPNNFDICVGDDTDNLMCHTLEEDCFKKFYKQFEDPLKGGYICDIVPDPRFQTK